jgi:hypothetical protein
MPHVSAGFATKHRAFRATTDIFRSTVQPSAWRAACCLLIGPIVLPSNSPLKNTSTSPYFVNTYRTTDKIIFTIDSRRLKTNNFVRLGSSLFWDVIQRWSVVTDVSDSQSVPCWMPRNVGNYQSTLRNIAEERGPHLHRGRRLKSCARQDLRLLQLVLFRWQSSEFLRVRFALAPTFRRNVLPPSSRCGKPLKRVGQWNETIYTGRHKRRRPVRI